MQQFFDCLVELTGVEQFSCLRHDPLRFCVLLLKLTSHFSIFCGARKFMNNCRSNGLLAADPGVRVACTVTEPTFHVSLYPLSDLIGEPASNILNNPHSPVNLCSPSTVPSDVTVI